MLFWNEMVQSTGHSSQEWAAKTQQKKQEEEKNGGKLGILG